MSASSPEKTAELVARLGLTFPVLSDPQLVSIRAFGVVDEENSIAWPALYILAADGTVLWRSLAETYTVRPASQVVLDALDGLPR